MGSSTDKLPEMNIKGGPESDDAPKSKTGLGLQIPEVKKNSRSSKGTKGRSKSSLTSRASGRSVRSTMGSSKRNTGTALVYSEELKRTQDEVSQMRNRYP